MLRLIIAGLDLDEIKELLRHLREFEEKNPSRLIACIVQGLEEKSVEEAKKVLHECGIQVSDTWANVSTS